MTSFESQPVTGKTRHTRNRFSLRTLRDELESDGSIRRQDDKLTFIRDVVFRSPSAAAVVLSGAAQNGRKVWKTADGRPLAQLEQSLLKVK